jgi:hypothetical protein
MSFPPANEIFQFAGFASCRYGFTTRYPLGGGLPHSEISGSPGARPSPELFAACHVLHRLSVPRHPPDALLVLAHAQPQDRATRAPRNPCVSIAPTRACAPAYLAYPCPGTTNRPYPKAPASPKAPRSPKARSILSCPLHTSRSRLASRCQKRPRPTFPLPGGAAPISAARPGLWPVSLVACKLGGPGPI